MMQRVFRRRSAAVVCAVLAIAVVVPSAATAAGGAFVDDDGSIFEPDIEWLAETGITQGCGTGMFCPDRAVTRGQMAAFLHRFAQFLGAEDGIVEQAQDAATLGGLAADEFLPDDGYVMVDGADFRSGGGDANFYIDPANGVSQPPDGSGFFVVAPVHVPAGARITGVTLYAWDNRDGDISLQVWVQRFGSIQDSRLMAIVDTGGSPPPCGSTTPARRR
jgi:hypothetical protein